ncbi:MAG: ABC-2 family transporter protein [Syntrophus sp. PtaB.Bin001]|nr:MAG: ABC-2 family transporter protein [Syntrophus sp. PtaB.Bin001]
MKVLATINKEFLLLIRDPGGLTLIFLMPLALVVVMALIQDNTFRGWQETKIEVLLVDEDHGFLGAALERTFRTSPNIRAVKEIDGKPLTVEEARLLVRSGKYKTAVIVPKRASGDLQKKTKKAVNRLLAHYGFTEKQPVTKELPSVNLQILFDPAIKPNYKQTLVSAVEKMAAKVQSDEFMDEVQKYLSKTTQKPKISMDLSEMINVSQEIAVENENRGMALNAVQHNVPAWSMFAMFFILFPLAGNLIKEREEGSMLRLRLISGSQLPVIAGKFFFYLFVCFLQLFSMVCVGLYGMPLLGLDKLILGSNYSGIIFTGLAVAMAATGYGLLIAVYFKTPQQALSFGSISVVILAAVGGVWVPVFVMPEIMQSISPYSPLNWGLTAFNDLFLRNASTTVILPELVKLVIFSIATLTASIFISKTRTVS